MTSRALGPISIVLLAFAILPGQAAAQEGAYYEVSDVEYYYAVGAPGTASATMGPDHSGSSQVQFQGCAWAKLRPDKDLGRINTIALLQGLPLEVEFTQFIAKAGVPDALAEDVEVVPALGNGTPSFPVHAAAAGWGNATIRLDDINFNDPATGLSTFAASWYVTDEGFRDDDTGAIVAPSTKEDWEMHLHLESMPGAPALEDLETSNSQPEGEDTPFPFGPSLLLPDDAHHEEYVYRNQRFGGHGNLSIEVSSYAPPGENDLRFALFSPDGAEIANVSVSPSLGQSTASDRIPFPLDQVGEYVVEVMGKVSLSQYTVTFEQAGPERFDLDMWWDAIVPGYDGLEVKRDCEDLMKGASLSGLVAPPPSPPEFAWIMTLVTGAAAITALLVTVKFMMMARAAAALRRATHG